MNLKQEILYFGKILLKNENIQEKQKYCEKAKHKYEIFNHISKVSLIENNSDLSSQIDDFISNIKDEIIYAELIIYIFRYFFQKNIFCYEIISNFNELEFTKIIEREINFVKLIKLTRDSSSSSIHILMNTSKLIDKKSIVPISNRKKISSNESLKKEIRGVIELKGGYYLAGSKNAKIGIFNQKDLELKGNLHLENIDEI